MLVHWLLWRSILFFITNSRWFNTRLLIVKLLLTLLILTFLNKVI